MWVVIQRNLEVRWLAAVLGLGLSMTNLPNSAAEETSPGDSNVHRHDDRPLEYRTSTRQPKHLEVIARQLQPLLGSRYFIHALQVENVVKVDLIIFPPDGDRNNWTIVTAGMSDKAMAVPASLSSKERKELELAELTISLPSDAFSSDASGQVSKDQFREGSQAWIVGLMAILAHLPHDYGTWLGTGHSIPNGDPPEPYTSYIPFSGVIIAPTSQWPEHYRRITTSSGPVNILSVVPVYQDEMNFLLAKGFDALHAELEAFGYTQVMSESRPDIGKILSVLAQ